MKNLYPLIQYRNECFQEFEDEISLVLWCHGCNMNCSWCSLKSIVYDKSKILDIDYEELIKNHTDLETAVVFLGGEPFTHPRGLQNGLELSKDLGLKTKIFTNGSDIFYIGYLIGKNLLNSISIDLKEPGFPSEKDLECVLMLSDIYNIDIEFRTTIHPGLSEDKLESIQKTVDKLTQRYYFKYIKQPYIEL